MSEKRIRELASHHPECRYPYNLTETECLCGYQYAMSFDPDVVAVDKVLRRHELSPAKTRTGKLYNKGWEDAISAVADNLERKFKFRLTDDGWEYLESEEA